MSTSATTTDALTGLVRQLADVQEQRAALALREDALKSALRAVAPLGKTQVAGLTLSVTQARTLDTAAAALAFPAAAHPELWVQTLDSKRLKAAVAPDAFEALMVANGEPRVGLK